MDNYHAGLALGILVGVIAASGLLAFLFKKKVLDCHFDERQERIRGMAYKYAFFTLMIAVWIYGALDLALGRWWLALFPGLSLVSVVALFALLGERARLLLSPASAQG